MVPPLSQSSNKDKPKIKQNESTNKTTGKTSTNNKNNTLSNRTQSVSSDVFNPSMEMDETGFTPVQSKTKRILSSEYPADPKKSKPMFVTTNRFSPLATNEENSYSAPIPTQSNEEIIEVNNEIKIKSPPPIFVRGVLDFFNFRLMLISLIGSENFLFKSSTNVLKIQTSNPDSYRKTIHLLKEKEAQFHTFQPQEEKAFRIVIRNLHPLTPTTEVGIAIENLGFSVRQVTNVFQKVTKNKLPMFFVDLEPAEINKDIFNLTSLLHTKIKVEEPHKRKDIMQCHNCQDYGHSKKYCAYSPRCVRCGNNHSSSVCTKSKDSPARCALCHNDHPANYKGCKAYKELQQHRHSSAKHASYGNKTNNLNVNFKNNNCESSQRLSQTDNTTPNHSFSYAEATSSNKPNALPTKQNTDINDLTTFLNNFQAIINPLIALLTTVLDSLICKNGK